MGSIAKFLWLLLSPGRSTPSRSRKAAGGEVRFLGDVENSPLPIERTIRRLADRYDRLQVCFEAGPMGYGLYRQVEALGHDCMVVAQALIPKRSGEHKTNRSRRGQAGTTATARRTDTNGVAVVPSPTHWRVG
jgi:transposase